MAWANGRKFFVIKQADCFLEIAKNTHTLGMVRHESLWPVTELPGRVQGWSR